ncbi:hypothetical protein KS08_13000 [Bacillus subtilis]|nr:hypothetical protein BAMTA208_13230 [Bacillus amyloliquefaciens TA208]AEK89827.1 hypothetical protein BAXH7_02701 [Bacillus amyloliquefaciens XH7]AIW34518.1 hypothetical protein KS08_13000 [Bacillus subtilis]QDP92904.1 hypothetical protein FOG69_12590 [Bacillus amyloliquefaciens]
MSEKPDLTFRLFLFFIMSVMVAVLLRNSSTLNLPSLNVLPMKNDFEPHRNPYKTGFLLFFSLFISKKP